MATVTGMHFVCRDDAKVTDHGDGTFESGLWRVAKKHAETAEYLAPHQAKDRRSYRQDLILRWYLVAYGGHDRVVFVLRRARPPQPLQSMDVG